MTKFVTDSDQLVVGEPASGRVTIKNDGSADSGPFDLHVAYTYATASGGSGEGTSSGTPVDNLAPGESIQLPIDLAAPEEGSYTYTATADSGGVVTESNEDDNTLTLSAAAVLLPNISFYGTPFYVNHYDDENGYRMTYNYENSGLGTATQEFKVIVSWSSVVASGVFPPAYCCVTTAGMSWGPGAGSESQPGPFNFPAPGTYTLIVTLDPENVVAESNEDDNTQTTTFEAP